jgi:hypothetical protein
LDKIQIPTGVIKKVNKIIESYHLYVIVKDSALVRNIAYTFQFISFINWVLNSTDISLIVGEQTVKYGIIAVNSIIESIVYDYLKQYPAVQPSEKSSEKNIEKLKQKARPAPQSLIDSLKKVHKKREKIHLRLWKGELEYKKYKIADYQEAKNALNVLMNCIFEPFGRNLLPKKS